MTKVNQLSPDAVNDAEVHAGHRGHHFMMMVCCIPMLVVAVVLVVTGVVSAGFLVYAAACLGMMFVMMRMMDRSGMKM